MNFPEVHLHLANFHLEILLVLHTSISLSTHDSFEPDSFAFNTDSRHIYRENNFLNYILTLAVIKFFPGNKSEETCSLSLLLLLQNIFLPFRTLFPDNSGDTSPMIQRITRPFFLPFFFLFELICCKCKFTL